jgi:hypothetical protein
MKRHTVKNICRLWTVGIVLFAAGTALPLLLGASGSCWDNCHYQHAACVGNADTQYAECVRSTNDLSYCHNLWIEALTKCDINLSKCLSKCGGGGGLPPDLPDGVDDDGPAVPVELQENDNHGLDTP